MENDCKIIQFPEKRRVIDLSDEIRAFEECFKFASDIHKEGYKYNNVQLIKLPNGNYSFKVDLIKRNK